MMFALSLVCIVQNRVPSKGAAKKISIKALSIPLAGPSIVDNHLASREISLEESGSSVKA